MKTKSVGYHQEVSLDNEVGCFFVFHYFSFIVLPLVYGHVLDFVVLVL